MHKLPGKLIDMANLFALWGPHSDLSVVVVQWLQVLVHVKRTPSQSHIEGPKEAEVPELIDLYEFQHNLSLRNDFEHTEKKHNEPRGVVEGAISPAYFGEFHSLVDKVCGSQAKTVFLPV